MLLSFFPTFKLSFLVLVYFHLEILFFMMFIRIYEFFFIFFYRISYDFHPSYIFTRLLPSYYPPFFILYPSYIFAHAICILLPNTLPSTFTYAHSLSPQRPSALLPVYTIPLSLYISTLPPSLLLSSCIGLGKELTDT